MIESMNTESLPHEEGNIIIGGNVPMSRVFENFHNYWSGQCCQIGVRFIQE